MSYISNFLTDVIVFWDKPDVDVNGNYIFGYPTQIKCHVKEVFKNYVLENGETFVCKAEILTDNEVMKAGGFVYFGELQELSEEEILDPRDNPRTFEIRTQNSVKLLDTKEKIKVFWL